MPFDAARDLRWSWRSLRARGARGVPCVLLLACAVAPNASVFAAAQLFGVRAVDPGLLTAILTSTLVVAILAAWQSARRATRVDPVVALRAE